MNSDKNFVLLRRFGGLHARVMLHKQDELAVMEKEMNALDFEEKTSYYLTSRQGDRNLARKTLLTKIERQLTDYGTEYPNLSEDDNNLEYYHRCKTGNIFTTARTS